MPSSLPPGPSDYFFGMRMMSKMKADVIGYYSGLQKEYGDTVSFQTGPYRFFVFFHPDQVHDVLVKHSKALIRWPRVMQTFAQWNGNSILIAEGKDWIRQRRLVQQGFQPKQVAGYTEAIVSATQILVDRWNSETLDEGSAEIEIRTAMRGLTLSTICRTMFNTDVSANSDEISEAVETLSNIAFDEMQAMIRLPMWIPTPANLRKRRAIDVLDRVVWQVVHERRREGGDQGDLLSMLLTAVDEDTDGTGLDDHQVRDEAMTLMLAGHDTTAAALEWMLFVLGRYPLVAKKCREEIERALIGRSFSAVDFTQFPYLIATVKETLRLYPPAFAVFARQATSDLEIGGYKVSKGNLLTLCSFVTHRDDRWFSEPTEFRPERFLAPHKQSIPAGAYFPFGAGPRVCIGQSFAMNEITLVAAMLLHSFDFELLPESNNPEPNVKMALRPKSPIALRIRRRK